MSPLYIVLPFVGFIASLLVIFALQWIGKQERDELTKKILAKSLTEYQQEEVMKASIRQAREPRPSLIRVPPTHLTLNELEADDEALERAHETINRE